MCRYSVRRVRRTARRIGVCFDDLAKVKCTAEAIADANLIPEFGMYGVVLIVK